MPSPSALNAVLARALEALRSMPLETSMEAVRAIEMVLRQERSIRSEGIASSDCTVGVSAGTPKRQPRSGPALAATALSIIEFHAPQAGHCPAHFGDWAPQSLQL